MTKKQRDGASQPETTSGERPAGRGRYHHGDLRNALLDAAGELIAESGPEAATLAAVARRVGVSAPACYRHFQDRDDLFAHLAARGFDALSERMQTAVAAHPQGSVDALIAGGQAYVAFVSSRPELFQVMWGAMCDDMEHERADGAAACCYGVFRETLGAAMASHGLGHLDAYAFGTPLWAMVHGVANLVLGRNKYLDRDAATLDAMIDEATRRYFDGFRSAAGRKA